MSSPSEMFGAFVERARRRIGTRPPERRTKWQRAAPWLAGWAFLTWAMASEASPFHVANAGNDSGPGSLGSPWRTITASLGKLHAGDTLYVRQGTYFEHPVAAVSGSPSASIVVRSYPGETATLDSGYPEFEAPGNLEWEPVDPSTGEYRSRRSYPVEAIYAYVEGISGYENGRVALVPYASAASFRDRKSVV